MIINHYSIICDSMFSINASIFDTFTDIVISGITDANETYDILDFEW